MPAPTPGASGTPQSPQPADLTILTNLIKPGWRKGVFKGHLAVKWENNKPTLQEISTAQYARSRFHHGIRAIKNTFSKQKVTWMAYDTNPTAIKATALYMYHHHPDWQKDNVETLFSRVGLPIHSENQETFDHYVQAHKEDLDLFMLEYTIEAAQDGDPQAIYDLSQMYSQGRGVPKDTEKAQNLLEIQLVNKAKEGNAQANYLLGKHYLEQEKPNLGQAESYLKQAADNGHPQAMYLLGELYTKKEPPNLEDQKYFKMAADLGVAKAQKWMIEKYKNEDHYIELLESNEDADAHTLWAVGRFCTDRQVNLDEKPLNGEAVKLFESGIRLLKKAAEKGDKAAQFDLGSMYEREIVIEKYQDHYQLEGSQVTKATEYYEQAAKQNHPVAQQYLGDMYAKGTGFTRQGNEKQLDREAVRLYKLSAAQGNAHAKTRLGEMYLQGRGVPQSNREAIRLFREAKNKDPIAQYNLGMMYENGLGVKKDYKEAFQCYSIAVKCNCPEAFYKLGKMYLKGWGVEKNDTQAVVYLENAVKFGDVYAMCALAELYEKGSHKVPQDLSRAEELYELAIAKGNAVAMRRLAAILEKRAKREKRDESLKEAMRLYQAAGKRGDKESLYKLADLLDQDGPHQDKMEAIKIRLHANKIRQQADDL